MALVQWTSCLKQSTARLEHRMCMHNRPDNMGGNNSLSHQTHTERWAVGFLLAVTVALYLGSAGIPALLDDTDSLYAEVSREMHLRHDWITPYTNTIRFLEKPPLLYWLTALSYMFCGARLTGCSIPSGPAVT